MDRLKKINRLIELSITDLTGKNLSEVKDWLEDSFDEASKLVKNSEGDLRLGVEYYGYDGAVTLTLNEHYLESDEDFEKRKLIAKRKSDKAEKKEIEKYLKLKSKYDQKY